MLRASAAAELAGVPTSSLVCEGFLGQAASTSSGLGMPNLPVAVVPGHVDTQPADELERNIVEVTLARVIENLTAADVQKAFKKYIDPKKLVIIRAGDFKK